MNKTLLMDFYELTMANGYYQHHADNQICYFDLFFRKNPHKGGYSIFCGLQTIIDYVNDFHFDEDDIAYLRSLNTFDENFLNKLKNTTFTGDIYAFEEGNIAFPNEPLVVVKSTGFEATMLETYLLLAVNHESLIATISKRIVEAADHRPVMEFGSRRAHGFTSANKGARSSYIAGCVGTANTLAGKLYNIPALGTMAHSWVQFFDDEYTAFKTYCELYPHNATLLVDTFDVINSGIPNAIKAFNTVLKPLGITKCGIRLDSGDMTYLSNVARKMLDEAGWTECKIVVSNSLDEYIITDLLRQGAKIDSFGVGEKLITSYADSVFGAVYKLAAVEIDGKIVPKIKRSENVVKITNPGFKKVYRIYENGMMAADLIALHDEEFDFTKPLTLYSEKDTWKKKEFINYEVEELLKPIFIKGKCVYKPKPLKEIRDYSMKQYERLYPEIKRFINPQEYYVDLSDKLYELKKHMLHNITKS